MNPADRINEVRRILRGLEKDLSAGLENDNSRARAPKVRMLHEVQGMLNPAFPYASQAGQDRVLDRVFGAKRGGTFVDIGAYDGITGSNSLFFEKWRGWTGVMVEPVEKHRNRAIAMRETPCLPYAIADESGTAEFMAVTEGFTQMSGLLEEYDARMLARVRQNPRHAETVISVETRTLSAVLDEAGIPNPDFVSLDIEGGELSALEAFPFADHKVSAWAIENNTGAPQLSQLMRSKGYNLIEFCGPDEIYVSSDLDVKKN